MNHLPRIYFLHIPKTAGTSFRSWLEDLFDGGGRLAADHLSELLAVSSEGLPQASFYSGHFGWKLMEMAEAAGISVVPITMLRDPLSQYSSGQKFMATIAEEDSARLGEARKQDVHASRSGSLQENDKFSPVAVVARENPPPVDVAESTSSVVSQQSSIEYSAFQNTVVRFIAHYGTEHEPPIPVDVAELEIAKERLKAMPFFGLVSDWERSVVLFADAFRLPLRKMDRFDNALDANKAPVNLPSHFVNDVKVFNALDFEFFDFAQDLFNKRYAALALKFGLSPNVGAEQFRAALKKQFIQAGRVIPRSERLREADIPVSASIIAEGFNHKYFDSSNNWLLWAGPENYCAIYLPIDRSVKREVRLTASYFQSKRIRDELVFLVDGIETKHRLEYRQIEDGTYVADYTLDVPSCSFWARPGYTEIGFRVVEAITMDDPSYRSAISFALVEKIKILTPITEGLWAKLFGN